MMILTYTSLMGCFRESIKYCLIELENLLTFFLFAILLPCTIIEKHEILLLAVYRIYMVNGSANRLISIINERVGVSNLKNNIIDIANKLLTLQEIDDIRYLSNNRKNLFSEMIKIDMKIGGAGIHNINIGDTGRYEIKDRDIFRPIQYIYAYLKMKPEDFDWVTREIIHMSGLHLESLIKRLFSVNRYPLGQALALPLAKLKIDHQLYANLKAVIKPYNNAKHHLEQYKDTHLFDVESALLYYVAVRKLSLMLLPITHLYTPSETWNSIDSEPTNLI